MTVADTTGDALPPHRVMRGDETLTPIAQPHRPADTLLSWAATLVVVAPNILNATANTTGAINVQEPARPSAPAFRGGTDSERAVSARQELLAREYARGHLSREEEARLLIATEKAAAYFPRVTADDYERLIEVAERSNAARELLAETDKLLADF